MMRPDLWNVSDPLAKLHFRARNMTGRATLHLIDDTGPVQLHQFEGFTGELRDGMQRMGSFGFVSVPLPGAIAATVHHGGYRSFNTAVGVEDPRYRPVGGQPGETTIYMVDGANAGDGTGGTAWKILQGLMGGICKLFGKTMVIGDSTNTTTIDVYGKTSVTIHSPAIVMTNGGSPSPVVTQAGPSTILKADA